MDQINFFAGPSILSKEVLLGARNAVENFENMGLSILEISHRSKQFVNVMEEAESLIRELLNINDDYAVLFLTGGASTQFFMAPMNLLRKTDKAAYINTGTWSNKAIKEAKEIADITEAASSKDEDFNYIPKSYAIDERTKYLHITSNNTIYGTEYHKTPNIHMPLVADMSSNIFSKAIDVTKYDLIYAGAQKNLGPAGTTLVIVRKDVLGKTERKIPTMLDYRTHIEKGSSFNTPPVYPIYVSMLTLRWIKSLGGVAAMETRNSAKAKLLYDEIDRNSLFYGTAKTEDRSKMNVCFKAKNAEIETVFIEEAAQHGLVGLKGHRSVGGMRASIYNAMEIAGVEKLVAFMKDYEERNS